MLLRVTSGVALLSAGLLAGAFGYGAVNLVAGFRAVPLDVRLTFHTALMQTNGLVMQTTMAVAALAALALAVQTRGRRRLVAGLACGLVVASFLITRFGNVPINGQIKVWAVSGAPAGYQAILSRWETFHELRTGTAVLAFALLVWLVLTTGRARVSGARAASS
ncbi:DUF1772 domain-containing protein [Longispora albida]|uniref:DUF1772 domain-containing protein n=1 Tax=Longispora albida TaxID=203523 RepID=UPI00036B02E4|nr:DUF1772 domain-containing protein [Longispora albida]